MTSYSQYEWIDVHCPADQFIINIGDLMMNWTNDKYVSNLHLEVPHPDTYGQRRMSIPFFRNPNSDALIEIYKVVLIVMVVSLLNMNHC